MLASVAHRTLLQHGPECSEESAHTTRRGLLRTAGACGRTSEESAHTTRRGLLRIAGACGRTSEERPHATRRELLRTAGACGRTSEERPHATRRGLLRGWVSSQRLPKNHRRMRLRSLVRAVTTHLDSHSRCSDPIRSRAPTACRVDVARSRQRYQSCEGSYQSCWGSADLPVARRRASSFWSRRE